MSFNSNKRRIHPQTIRSNNSKLLESLESRSSCPITDCILSCRLPKGYPAPPLTVSKVCLGFSVITFQGEQYTLRCVFLKKSKISPFSLALPYHGPSNYHRSQSGLFKLKSAKCAAESSKFNKIPTFSNYFKFFCFLVFTPPNPSIAALSVNQKFTPPCW